MISQAEPVHVRGTEEILDNARGLLPRLRERAAETESLRRLPDSTIEDAAREGIFSLLVPRSLGGAGGNAQDFADLLRILAQADMSTSWSLGFLTAHNWMIARFPEDVQDEVFGDGPPSLLAMVAHPVGRAVPVEGGYEVTGHWRYCSGVMHADWVVVTAIIDGAPNDEVSMFLLPIGDAQIVDTWFMAGMQGSGSNDVKLSSQFVPTQHCIDFDGWWGRDNPGAPRHPEAIYGYDARNLLGLLFPAMAVGAAEGLLDDYRARLETRRAAFSSTITGDTVAGQMRYARALSSLRVAQVMLQRLVDTIIEANASSPEGMSDELRVGLKLDGMSACRMAWESVQIGLAGSGSSIFRSSDPAQRTIRDLMVLLSHMTIDEDGFLTRSGEILLGRSTEENPTVDFIA